LSENDQIVKLETKIVDNFGICFAKSMNDLSYSDAELCNWLGFG